MPLVKILKVFSFFINLSVVKIICFVTFKGEMNILEKCYYECSLK
jgi:hypothetical protein